MSEQFWTKVNEMCTAAILGLSPEDRDERILNCRETGQHGITAHPEGDMISFSWGGKTLCAVERSLLADDGVELPAPQFVPEVPDDLSSL